MIRGLKAVARERASMERNRIVLSTMVDDMFLSESFMESELPEIENEEYDEIDKLIDSIPVQDMDDREASDIDQIIQSEESMEVDDMLAIQDAID